MPRLRHPGSAGDVLLLADLIHRFICLKAGLAVVLVFDGVKMLLLDVYKIPIWLSIAVIATTITVAVVWSLRATREQASPSQDQAPTSPEPATRDAPG